MKELLFGIVTLVVILVVLGGGARLMGIPPMKIEPFIDTVSQQPFMVDTTLGFTLKPGHITYDFELKLISHAVHLPNHTRYTGSTPEQDSAKKTIGFFGCSFTYGRNLDDSMTEAWKVQSAFKDRFVTNYGVDGYGLAKEYLLLQRLEKENKLPDIIIVNYLDDHDGRTAFSSLQRKKVVPYYLMNAEDPKNKAIDSIIWPYYRLSADNDSIELHRIKLIDSYDEWPLVRISALANFAEYQYCMYKESKLNIHLIAQKVALAMVDLANRNGKKILFAAYSSSGDEQSQELFAKVKKEGASTLFYDIDLSGPEYTLYPLDQHPNSAANTIFADSVVNFIDRAGW
jgi:hypothetical protein